MLREMITTAKISFIALSVGVLEARGLPFQLAQLDSGLQGTQRDGFTLYDGGSEDAAMVQ